MPITDVDLVHRMADSNIRQRAEQQFGINARIRRKSKGELNRPYTPDEQSSAEYMALYKKAVAPFVETIVQRHADVLQIDGYSGPDTLYRQWLRNSMQAKQDNVNFEALQYGYSYLAILPDEAPGNVVFHHMSARNTFAVYDNAFSTYPTMVLQKISKDSWYYLDAEVTAEFSGSPDRVKDLRISEHGLGYTPVVRLEKVITPPTETPESPIAGLFGAADSLSDARFSLALVSRRLGFPQRWATGLSEPDPDGKPINMNTQTLVTDTNTETKFGQFEAANLSNLQVAVDSNLRDLAYLANIPPHHFSQSVSNLSAEALASLELAFNRTKSNNQQALAVGYNLAFATAADILGIETAPEDAIHWQDLDSRSLPQAAAAMELLDRIGAPEEAVFRLLPGSTQQEAKEAAEYARSRKSAAAATALISLDAQRLANAKTLQDLGYSKEEALRMAGYRIPNQ